MVKNRSPACQLWCLLHPLSQVPPTLRPVKAISSPSPLLPSWLKLPSISCCPFVFIGLQELHPTQYESQWPADPGDRPHMTSVGSSLPVSTLPILAMCVPGLLLPEDFCLECSTSPTPHALFAFHFFNSYSSFGVKLASPLGSLSGFPLLYNERGP